MHTSSLLLHHFLSPGTKMPPQTIRARATLQGWQGGDLKGSWVSDTVGCYIGLPYSHIKNK